MPPVGKYKHHSSKRMYIPALHEQRTTSGDESRKSQVQQCKRGTPCWKFWLAAVAPVCLAEARSCMLLWSGSIQAALVHAESTQLCGVWELGR